VKLPFTAPVRIVAGIFVAVAAVYVVSAAAGHPLFALRALGIIGEERTAASDVLLREIRDLYSLTTVEYVHKTVFPHDYLGASLNFDSILRKLRAGRGKVNEILDPQEKDYLEACNLASAVGLDTGKDACKFVVVTAVIRGGFDLEGTALDPRADLSPEQRSRRFPVSDVRDPSTGKRTGRSIRIELPRPVITDVVIEDPKPETYTYPDVELKPEHWKLLAAFVESRVRKSAEREGILKAADENCREFLKGLLSQAGFTHVEFAVSRDFLPEEKKDFN